MNKICSKCQELLDQSKFYFHKTKNGGYYINVCKKCFNKDASKRILKNRKTPGSYAWSYRKYYKIRDRAKKRGIAFTLTFEEYQDICQSEQCPYCEKKYSQKSRLDVITIDRINSSLGYTKKNCIACCWACNVLKRDMSPEEMRLSLRTLVNMYNMFKH